MAAIENFILRCSIQRWRIVRISLSTKKIPDTEYLNAGDFRLKSWYPHRKRVETIELSLSMFSKIEWYPERSIPIPENPRPYNIEDFFGIRIQNVENRAKKGSFKKCASVKNGLFTDFNNDSLISYKIIDVGLSSLKI